MRRMHIFDDFMKIRWRGVMGLPMRCTKMDQNGPKWSPYHDRAKVFQICPEWLIWSHSGLNGHLKEDRSQEKSWRGHGVTHGVHQNGPNCTNVVTLVWQCKSVLNLSWVTYMIFIWIKWHLKGDRSQDKSWRGHGVTHEIHQNAPKWTKMDQNWCILVHLMCDYMTPPWLVLNLFHIHVSI